MNALEAIRAGVEHHRAGRIQEAERCYRHALAMDERSFDALHLLGVLTHELGENERSLELLDRALSANSRSAEAHRNRGDVYRVLGRLRDAQLDFEAAIALNPKYAEAQNDLGITLAALGRHIEAVEKLERAVATKPAFPEAQFNLGSAYNDLGRLGEAAACYERAIEISPDFALAHARLGQVLQRAGHYAEALAKYQEALAIDPKLVDGHVLLGHMLHDQGMFDDSLDCFKTAVELEPGNVEARWALTMSQLALFHSAGDKMQANRADFSSAMAELERWIDESRLEEGANAVGTKQPFYLAYHERNNREILSLYGDLCSRLTQAWQKAEGIVLQPMESHEVLRIGVVSGQIRDHSVWHAIIKGWLRHLDPRRFSIHVFHTGFAKDAETTFAESRSQYFAHAPKAVREWVEDIVRRGIDVLIYPEIGMDPVTLKLASMRLAPVQAVAWGHPETSGLPTIDYYLSAEDFEPENAQENYREQLIALPHLGCCYDPPPSSEIEVDLEEFGIDVQTPILICPGVPFKYGPQHDWMLVEIAKRLKKCQFVFFKHAKENLSEALEQRLDAAFEASGFYFSSYGVFLPWLKRDAFYALMRQATVFLDTIGFSGFNTAIQAIECALPIVTTNGRFMRGRLASGILKRMGMQDLVAESEEGYIALAVRLGKDRAYNEQIRERIRECRALLFNDLAPIRGLERFLIDAVKKFQHRIPAETNHGSA